MLDILKLKRLASDRLTTPSRSQSRSATPAQGVSNDHLSPKDLPAPEGQGQGSKTSAASLYRFPTSRAATPAPSFRSTKSSYNPFSGSFSTRSSPASGTPSDPPPRTKETPASTKNASKIRPRTTSNTSTCAVSIPTRKLRRRPPPEMIPKLPTRGRPRVVYVERGCEFIGVERGTASEAIDSKGEDTAAAMDGAEAEAEADDGGVPGPGHTIPLAEHNHVRPAHFGVGELGEVLNNLAGTTPVHLLPEPRPQPQLEKRGNRREEQEEEEEPWLDITLDKTDLEPSPRPSNNSPMHLFSKASSSRNKSNPGLGAELAVTEKRKKHSSFASFSLGLGNLLSPGSKDGERNGERAGSRNTRVKSLSISTVSLPTAGLDKAGAAAEAAKGGEEEEEDDAGDLLPPMISHPDARSSTPSLTISNPGQNAVSETNTFSIYSTYSQSSASSTSGSSSDSSASPVTPSSLSLNINTPNHFLHPNSSTSTMGKSTKEKEKDSLKLKRLASEIEAAFSSVPVSTSASASVSSASSLRETEVVPMEKRQPLRQEIQIQLSPPVRPARKRPVSRLGPIQTQPITTGQAGTVPPPRSEWRTPRARVPSSQTAIIFQVSNATDANSNSNSTATATPAASTSDNTATTTAAAETAINPRDRLSSLRKARLSLRTEDPLCVQVAEGLRVGHGHGRSLSSTSGMSSFSTTSTSTTKGKQNLRPLLTRRLGSSSGPGTGAGWGLSPFPSSPASPQSQSQSVPTTPSSTSPTFQFDSSSPSFIGATSTSTSSETEGDSSCPLSPTTPMSPASFYAPTPIDFSPSPAHAMFGMGFGSSGGIKI